MGFKMALTMLPLRILSLLLLVASAVVLFTNTSKQSDGSKLTFEDIFTYRYVIGIAAIGVLYEILQLPFAVYYAATEKRLVNGSFLPEFDFYADKVAAFLVASGVGAGFAVSFELKKELPDLLFAIAAFAEASGDIDGATLAEQAEATIAGFLNRGYIACGALLAAFVSMAIVSFLSSINRSN